MVKENQNFIKDSPKIISYFLYKVILKVPSQLTYFVIIIII